MCALLPAVFLAAATAGTASNAGCPAREAIAAELERLGTAAAVAALGSPEVTVQGTRMQVALRGLDGVISGAREVTAPASCPERAGVAAVLISAWVGAWSAGSFPEPAPPPSSSAGLTPAVAPAPRALAPGPAETTPPRAEPAGAGPGTMHLTPVQLADLRSAGASLDAEDMAMADRLGRKGFVGDELVAAYRKHNAMKAAHPELASYGGATVESIAYTQKMGLGEDDAYWFVRNRHQRSEALTQAHTEKAPSGRSLVKFGAVATAAGAALLAVGLVLASDVTFKTGRGNVTSGWGYLGEGMATTGAVSLAAGVSIAVLGLFRWTAPGAGETTAP